MTDEFWFLGRLSPADPKPASQQIAYRIREAIEANELGPGDRLPSHHDLRVRYGVARETVKRAIDILRRERLVIGRQGIGVFVCSTYRCEASQTATHEPGSLLVNDKPLQKCVGEMPVRLVFTACVQCGVVMVAMQIDGFELERDDWRTYGDLVIGLHL